jgi:hypothetical protein
MAYVTSEARQQLLDDVAQAIDQIGRALAALGEAYEQLDEKAADALEEQLFRPVQAAYGRAKRTHAEFATRHRMRKRSFAPVARGAPSRGVRGFLEVAVDAVTQADHDIAELQDSLMPIEVGDPELRAGLAEVRVQLGQISARAAGLMRVLGR